MPSMADFELGFIGLDKVFLLFFKKSISSFLFYLRGCRRQNFLKKVIFSNEKLHWAIVFILLGMTNLRKQYIRVNKVF